MDDKVLQSALLKIHFHGNLLQYMSQAQIETYGRAYRAILHHIREQYLTSMQTRVDLLRPATQSALMNDYGIASTEELSLLIAFAHAMTRSSSSTVAQYGNVLLSDAF